MCSWKPVGNWAWTCRSCFIQETCRTCPLVQHSGTDIFKECCHVGWSASQGDRCSRLLQRNTSWALWFSSLTNTMKNTSSMSEMSVWHKPIFTAVAVLSEVHSLSLTAALHLERCELCLTSLCFEPVNGLLYRKSDWELIKHCKWDVTLFL